MAFSLLCATVLLMVKVEKEKALKNKGKGSAETSGWRSQGVEARLTHSLIKGIDQYVVEVRGGSPGITTCTLLLRLSC